MSVSNVSGDGPVPRCTRLSVTVPDQLSWLNCPAVVLPGALTLTIYFIIGVSCLRTILTRGAGKNGSTVAVRSPLNALSVSRSRLACGVSGCLTANAQSTLLLTRRFCTGNERPVARHPAQPRRRAGVHHRVQERRGHLRAAPVTVHHRVRPRRRQSDQSPGGTLFLTVLFYCYAHFSPSRWPT